MSLHLPRIEFRPLEPLEGRVLFNGGPGRGNDHDKRDDDDRSGKGSQISQDLALTAVADFNGDDKADVVTVARVPDPRKDDSKAQGPKKEALTLLIGKGDGTFTASPAVNIDVSKAERLLAADFDKDGDADLAVLRGSRVSVYAGDGAGKLATTPVTSDIGRTFPRGVSVAAGDINGDRAADLVAFNTSNVWFSLNDGAAKFLPAVQQDNPFAPAVPVALGDLDNDTRADLLGVEGDRLIVNKARAATGEFMLSYLPKMADSIPLAGKRLLIADVNGDNANDVIALGDGSVHVALQQFDPTQLTSLGPWVETDVDIHPDKVLVGDVNGDGRADLFQLAGGKKQVHRATLLLTGNADGTFHKLIVDDDRDDDDDHDDDDRDRDDD